MDINNLNTRQTCDDGAKMVVRGPDGKDTDFVITFAGMDGALWEQIRRDEEQEEKISIQRMIAKAALSWTGLVNNGEPVECTYENVYDLFTKAPYILTQADAFVSNRQNFLPPNLNK